MKLFADKKIRLLFGQVSLLTLFFTLFFALLYRLYPKLVLFYILASPLCLGLCISAVLYRYFRDRHQILDNAAAQIRKYLSGNSDARIPCEEEGQLYRLFHEVNSIVSILNAHTQKEAEAKLFLKDTICDISHQLKTPLAALTIYSGILQEESADPETVREFASLSEQELERLETLVQNLLKITKLDAGTVTFEKTEESMGEMMEEVRRRFAYQAARSRITLSFFGDPDAVLLCDRLWFTEALGNLIKNALEHTQQGDSVRIEWKTFASMVQITVKDNGSGIHPEDLHHIFKRFYRSRFSKDTAGVGLGLPLAKAIVQAHGGTMEADSEPGTGTTFTMNFSIPTKL